jgi:hypothetical protein
MRAAKLTHLIIVLEMTTQLRRSGDCFAVDGNLLFRDR